MKKHISLVFIISILFIGCLGAFVRSNWDLWRYPGITSLKTGIMSFGIKGYGERHKLKGVLVPHGKYLIGLKHCFTPYMCDPFYGCFDVPSEDVIDSKYMIDGIEIKNLNYLDDIVIFSFPDNLDYILPVRWGNSNDLRVGDRVLSIGNSGLKGINVREGIVSRLDYDGDDLKFIISTSSTNGDSGSPVLYMKNGVLWIIGLVQASVPGADYTIVVKAEKIERAIKGI